MWVDDHLSAGHFSVFDSLRYLSDRAAWNGMALYSFGMVGMEYGELRAGQRCQPCGRGVE